MLDIPAEYSRVIVSLTEFTGWPDSLLHVHVGLVIFFGTMAFTGTRSPAPIVLVIIAELANEVLDRLYGGWWRWPDAMSDAFHTLLWPTLVYAGLNWKRFVRSLRSEKTLTVPAT